MKKLYVKKAFTLPEILVGMSIISIVIFAATSVLVSVIRSNSENINTMIAYGLAQEGLEAVRNIRDSNWLLGANFHGELGTKSVQAVWGAVFPKGSGAVRYYIVDFQSFDASSHIVKGIQDVSAAVPWKLKDLGTLGGGDEYKKFGMGEQTLLFKEQQIENSFYPDEVHYVHSKSSQSLATPFHRYLKIEVVSYAVNDKIVENAKFRVSSVVNWQEQGRKKEILLETELTDWKQD